MINKFVVLFAIFCILGVACSVIKKASTAEGKVVDGKGKPLSGIKIVATQKEPVKGYEQIQTSTKEDGTFIITGLYPSADYMLSFEGGQCDYVAQTEFTSAPRGKTRTLQRKVVLKFSSFDKSRGDVVVDLRTGLEWVPAPDKLLDWYESKQYVDNLSIAGGGWRLPTLAELTELYKTGKVGCGCREIAGDRSIWASDLHAAGDLPGIIFNFKVGRGAYTPPSSKDTFSNIGVVGVRARK